jgi:hypothetical protein
MRPLTLVLILAGLLAPWLALAKRGPAPKVPPVEQDGVRYIAPNDDGRRGYIQARDIQSGKLLWEVTVFRTAMVPGLEQDVQWVFVQKLSVEEGKLSVVDERGRRYRVDPKTQAVEELKKAPPKQP